MIALLWASKERVQLSGRLHPASYQAIESVEDRTGRRPTDHPSPVNPIGRLQAPLIITITFRDTNRLQQNMLINLDISSIRHTAH